MRLKHYSEEKLKKEILVIISKYLDLSNYKVFFFGSRVTEKGTDHSDIDVGIEGEHPVPLSIMAEILDDIEKIPTLYIIEIVDFGRVESKFRSVALSEVEYLNPDVEVSINH